MTTSVPIHRPAARPHTMRAFLLAPGIAAAAGAALVPVILGSWGPSSGRAILQFWSVFEVLWPVFAFFWAIFAFFGYLTTIFIAVPIYLVLPERARSGFAVVVPLAGAIAAAPWLLKAIASNRLRPDLSMTAIGFALGCTGGIAFLFLRRTRDGSSAGDRPRA